MKLLKSLILLTFFTISAQQLFAQYEISNAELIPVIKKGTTFFIMPNTTSDLSKSYQEVISQCWKFNTIKFITVDEIDANLSPENSFIELTKETIETMKGMGTKYQTSKLSYCWFFHLWKGKDKMFAKNKKLKQHLKEEIARLELYPDIDLYKDEKLLDNTDCDYGGHFRNWGLGYAKNLFQQLAIYLKKGKEKKLHFENEFVNKAQINKLRRDTLFIPQYLLIKERLFISQEKKRDESMFEDYKKKHQLLSEEELNDKIVNCTKPFYYISYVHDDASKWFCVVNAFTGEVVYCDFSHFNANAAAGDFKDLYKAIMAESK